MASNNKVHPKQNQEEEHLPPYKIRPRFKNELPLTPMQVEEKLGIALNQENAPVIGRIKYGFASIYLPPDQQYFWSPGLTLTIEETEKGSLLRGMYGPRPAVWTMFVFFYSLISFAILVLSIVGFTNYSLGKFYGFLWGVPILLLIFLSLYLVAYFGQKMGHGQMIILHRFLEESLEHDFI